MDVSFEAKGTGLRTTITWINEHFGQQQFDQMLAPLPEAQRLEVSQVNVMRWYAADIASALFTGVAQTFTPDQADARDAKLRALGRFIAEDNVNAIYRFLFNMAKPASLLKLLPKMWGKYFRPVHVTIHDADLGAGKANMKVDKLRVDYIAPIAEGWMEYAYELVGASSVRVREQNYAQGHAVHSPMSFDIEWTA